MTLVQLQSPRKALRAAAITIAVLLGVHTVSLLGFPSHPATQLLHPIIFVALNFAGVVAMFWAGWTNWQRNRRFSCIWFFVCLSITMPLIGMLATVDQFNNPQIFFLNNIGQYFYPQYYLFLFLGSLLIRPQPQLKQTDWWRVGLDIVTLLAASLLAAWSLVDYSGQPIDLMGRLDFHVLGNSLGMLLHLASLLIISYRLPNKISPTHPLVLLALAVLLRGVSDVVYFNLIVLHFRLVGMLAFVGYSLSHSLIALAGLKIWFYPEQCLDEPREPQLNSSYRSSFISFLPFVWSAAAFIIYAINYDQPRDVEDNLSIVTAGFGIIISMVVVRQMLVVWENARLSTNLQQALRQVKQQAADLEQANRELQSEIIERKRAEQQLSYDALHDALTNLPNRVLFMDRLGQAARVKQRNASYQYSVLFLDLDSFKVINDSLGHKAGDQLLVDISQRLTRCLRLSDTVARFGGDEFVLLLEDTHGTADAISIADRILAEIKKPFHLSSNEVFISGSIGIVPDVDPSDGFENVLRDADLAMYHAKTNGKSCYAIFQTVMRESAITRMEIENNLRNAIHQRQFELYYQPILALQAGELVGFEALIRWRHPQRGLVMPGEFISIAEETGLIIPLGQWILTEACQQMVDWKAAYPEYNDLIINVNISGRQINQANFVEQVREVLDETGLPGSALVLEITESVYVDNRVKVQNMFEQLGCLGVQVQIDDFGTGYSSLSYLQRFPVRCIKIDRSFVNEMTAQSSGQADGKPDMVRAILSLAQGLGMETVAEGVETEEQYQELQRLGCPYGQGYLISRPMSRQAAADWLQTRLAQPA